MVDNQPETDGDPATAPSHDARKPVQVPSVDAYAVISYLLSGVILYGAIGWLLDWWLGTRGFVGGGIVLGAAAGIWLVWLRYGRS
jgi:F0F1-type ATP synthase assembly protein I